VAVTRRVALRSTVQAENAGYLRTKVERMRHLLDLSAPLPISADFFPETLIKNGRCFVTLSFAQSLDGSITAKRGQWTEISGAESMIVTHQLRAAHQAILVGIGAVLSDDPRLTVRLVDGANPQPVVLDSQLQMPPTAKLLQNPHRPWVFTTMAASEERATALEDQGAVIIRVASNGDGRVSLTAVLEYLHTPGIESVMVEGGAQIITSFLLARLVDHMVITIAPKLLGGLNVIGAVNGAELPHLENAKYHICGTDMVLSGEVGW